MVTEHLLPFEIEDLLDKSNLTQDWLTSSKHFKSYKNYRGLLKERFHKGKPNGFTCKICSVIYLKKWAMFKHFFSNHPIETIETGIILSIKDFQ